MGESCSFKSETLSENREHSQKTLITLIGQCSLGRTAGPSGATAPAVVSPVMASRWQRLGAHKILEPCTIALGAACAKEQAIFSSIVHFGSHPASAKPLIKPPEEAAAMRISQAPTLPLGMCESIV